MPPPSEVSSTSPTPSSSSRITQRWPESMTSIRESDSEVEADVFRNKPNNSELTVGKIRHRIRDEDDDDDDLLVTSGDLDDNKSGKVGLFDVVKREFRCKTAVITNRAAYEDPMILSPRKAKVNFIQDMKTKVSVGMELKNKGVECVQAKNYREATKLFHQAMLYIKGLDPDEGVTWSPEFESMDKDKMPLRVMPSELKEIKEAVEIDCFLNLAVCLMHKERVPYRRIKEYCLRVLDIRDDNVKALMRAGMACYYLREYELSRYYLQNAKEYSHEPIDLNIKKYLHMVERELAKSRKKK
ncbi:tetratricopeptide repeat protein 9C-like [Ciona intestinalis]